MAATLSANINALVPSENWDDDFEFNPHDMNKHNNKRPNDHYHEFNPQTPPSTSRMSIVSSQYTQEDWDADSRQGSPQQSTKVISSSSRKIPSGSPTRRSHDTENWDDESHTSQAAIRLTVGDRTSPTSITPSRKQHQYTPPPPTAIGVLTDKKNLKTPPPLETWAEPGPSTPSSKRASINSNCSGCAAVRETENWDDDFDLDKPDSPARLSVKKGVKPRATKKAQLVESWDDEFSLTPLRGTPSKGPSAKSRLSSSPSRSRVNATGRAAHLEYSSSSESEDELPRPLHYPSPQHNLYGGQEQEDDDLGEFGHVPKHHNSDEEEDRTVTARTRHRLARQSNSLANSSPPPPMPSLPLFARPFPRSPTSSVFSVPATTQTHSSYNSTTHLRPTISRSSSGAGGLAGLPPSPPIHKERERRRLRKKSRPHNVPNPQMYELTAVRPQPYAMPTFSDGELEITEHEEDVHRPRTPSPPPPISIPSTPCGGGNGPTLLATPQSQIRAGALLSRIGSVKKKWSVGGRKRGASVTPAEVVQDCSQTSQDSRGQSTHTPRPQSSLSSLQRHTPPPPTSNLWFFRGHGASGREEVADSRAAVGGSRSGSMTDLSLRESEVPSGSKLGKERETAKLVKRKSLGFVHLRRGHVSPSSPPNEPAETGRKQLGKRPISMQTSSPSPASHRDQQTQRHVSYAHAKGVRDREAEEMEREAEKRKGEQEKEKEEGSRSFMGSVRRISLVGARRHQRTKSGVSLSGVVATIGAMGTTGPRRGSLDGNKVLDGQVTGEKDKNQANSGPSSNVNRNTKHLSPNATPTAIKKASSCPPTELLPPIELQPPSPPRVKLSIPRLPSNSTTSAATKPPTIPNSNSLPTRSHVSDIPTLKSPPTPSSSVLKAPTTPGRRPSPSSPTNKSPSSPQSASLGRTAALPSGAEPSSSGSVIGAGSVPRRNSLGDLKIPARISQAQVGLRRDLGMVREFAANIEQLKELQQTYHTLVLEVQSILDMHAQLHATSSTAPPLERATSPTLFSLKKTRPRSNTNPTASPRPSLSQLAYKELASAFYTINSKYRIPWECAELLIELGSGSAGSTGPPSSVSVPVMHGGSERNTVGKGRERAITLAGDESKPPTPRPGQLSSTDLSNLGRGPPFASPPSLAWRASTGRHDLSQRQLVLLREMLNNADASIISEDSPHLSIPEEPPSAVSPNDTLQVNREWRWGGDAMSSTITLPSEESTRPHRTPAVDANKKRRSSRLGMSGIRDMLRALRRNNTDSILPIVPPLPPPPMPASSTSLSTDSSFDGHSQHRYAHPRIFTQGSRRRPKGSTGPDSVRSTRDARPISPYNPSSLSAKPSPRRPSLASIFRLGTKNRLPTPPNAPSTMDSGESNNVISSMTSVSTGEEDWDRMDSASDLDAAAKALGIPVDGAATLKGGRNKLKSKGRSPYLQHEPSVTGSFIAQLTPKRSASGSQSSIWGGGGGGDSPSNQAVAQSRSTRLSNVEEHGDDHRLACVPPVPPLPSSHGGDSSPSNSRRMTRAGPPASGSVRSMPQHPVVPLPDPKLAMTPENIKPLLENAKEVHSRLNECITEIRGLMQGGAGQGLK